MKYRLEHMGLAAKDTTGLARWYQEVLGWELLRITDETPPAYFLKEPGGTILEIIPATGGNSIIPARSDAGWRHAALLTDDFDVLYQELSEAGVMFDSVLESGKNKVAFFRDPEGNLLHLIQRGEPL
jgi:glyoxylase I family protein